MNYLSSPKHIDYYSNFQERAYLHKTLKEKTPNKLIIRKYYEEAKKSNFIKQTNEVERGNSLLSKKLIEIISKKPRKNIESYKIKHVLQTIEKTQYIEADNLRIFKVLTNMKPCIDTKEMKKEWKITKGYKRNLTTFNKYSQNKTAITFINNNSNRNIDNYLKEVYLPDKTNVLNYKAPNFIVKNPSQALIVKIRR